MKDRATLNLQQLVTKLRQSLGIIQKQDIQIANKILELQTNSSIRVGDDCAAIPDGDGYLLFAAEGMWHVLIEQDPWFAGWCAVMVNVSDIAAMGGRAVAVVDTIWTKDPVVALPLLAGMKAASQAYNVPIVGGHSNFRSAYNALTIAILGRAKQLITSFNAKPGDLLVAAINLQGKMHPEFPFWDGATTAAAAKLRQDLEILPYLAEKKLCTAGKDISMGGIVGTLLMLLEASQCGAVLNLEQVCCPADIDFETWLLCFPSYGFLLSINPKNLYLVQAQFKTNNISCAVVGKINRSSQLTLKSSGQSHLFWDWKIERFIL